MKRAKLLMSAGIWVAILPYLGFPYLLKNIFFALTGLFVAYVSYGFYVESQGGGEGRNFDSFSEKNGDKL